MCTINYTDKNTESSYSIDDLSLDIEELIMHELDNEGSNENVWLCSVCGLLNSKTTCLCGQKNSLMNEKLNVEAKNNNISEENVSSQSQTWLCSICGGVTNNNKCCEVSTSNENQGNEATDDGPRNVEEDPNDGTWECAWCMIKNNSENFKCKDCGHLRLNFTANKVTSTRNNFENGNINCLGNAVPKNQMPVSGDSIYTNAKSNINVLLSENVNEKQIQLPASELPQINTSQNENNDKNSQFSSVEASVSPNNKESARQFYNLEPESSLDVSDETLMSRSNEISNTCSSGQCGTKLGSEIMKCDKNNSSLLPELDKLLDSADNSKQIIIVDSGPKVVTINMLQDALENIQHISKKSDSGKCIIHSNHNFCSIIETG